MAGQQHTCKDFSGELQAYALGTLSKSREEALTLHLEGCDDCRTALAVCEGVLQALDAVPDVDPPAGLAQATLRRIDRASAETPQRMSPPVFAFTALGLCAVLAIILLPALSRSREAARRSSSANNLKQMGLVFKMYANESEGGLFPPMAAGTAAWLPDLRTLYPEYISDFHVLVSPSASGASESIEELEDIFASEPVDWDRANAIFRESYAYIGWAVKDSRQLREVEAERMGAAIVTDVEGMDSIIADEVGDLFPLREGIERFFITDINNPAGSAAMQSEIPVMIEVCGDRRTLKGAHVLFMDGHVTFITYGQWPVVDEVLDVLYPQD
jgi:prepilin-type processing-associated H-X9-DG protein